jgi:hypothetical protein
LELCLLVIGIWVVLCCGFFWNWSPEVGKFCSVATTSSNNIMTSRDVGMILPQKSRLVDGRIVTTGATQSLTNKTLTTAKADAGLDVQEIATPSAPSSGYQRLYAKNDGNLYRLTAAGVESVLGGGSSSGVNVIPFASQNGSSGWGSSNATVSTDTTPSFNPLSSVTTSTLSISSSTSGGYGRIRWTQPLGLQNQPNNISFWSLIAATGDYKVELYYNAASNYGGAYTRVPLNSDVGGVSNINGGNTQFKSFFIEQGQLYYEMRIVRTAASSVTAFLTQIGVGVLSQLGNGFAGTDWQPVSGATAIGSSNGLVFTNTTITNLRYKRIGDSASFSGRVDFAGTPGTGTGALTIAMPGIALDTTKILSYSARGKARYKSGSTTYYFDAEAGVGLGTSVYIDFTRSDGAGVAAATFQPGSGIPTTPVSGDYLEFECLEVPITGWSSNVTMADRSVEEYAYNTDVSSTASVTASGFGNGTVGQLISASWATGTTYTRRVRFAIQPTDKFVLEVGRGGVWAPIEEFIPGVSTSRQASLFYGATIDRVSGSTTDVDVLFENGGFRPSSSASYGVAGDAWSILNASSFTWRVRKVSGGASVGYPVGARNVVGDVSGTAVPAGMIGEQIRSAVTSPSSFSATTNYADAMSITLTPGVWDVSLNLITFQNGATLTNVYFGVSSTSGNSSTGLVFGDNAASVYPPNATSNTSSGSIPQYRILVPSGSSVIYYFKLRGDYTIATPTYQGRISAVRVA